MLPPRVPRETGPQFVRRVLQEQRQGTGFGFTILRARSADVIGQIRLMNWTRMERQAEVGYWLQRKHWGKGYGTEALRLVCSFGFESLRLHRIVASVVEGNAASTKVLEKVGFRLEGRRRLAARLSRGWANTLEYGLLNR
jgi:[ribosomal protein S5]-alanine N-acetyltransferase